MNFAGTMPLKKLTRLQESKRRRKKAAGAPLNDDNNNDNITNLVEFYSDDDTNNMSIDDNSPISRRTRSKSNIKNTIHALEEEKNRLKTKLSTIVSNKNPVKLTEMEVEEDEDDEDYDEDESEDERMRLVIQMRMRTMIMMKHLQMRNPKAFQLASAFQKTLVKISFPNAII